MARFIVGKFPYLRNVSRGSTECGHRYTALVPEITAWYLVEPPSGISIGIRNPMAPNASGRAPHFVSVP